MPVLVSLAVSTDSMKRVVVIPFKKCPVCGGELVSKEVEKVLRGGNHTAVVKAFAEVCLHCGERLYSPETIKRFEEIRAKLEREETADFQPVGQSFRVITVVEEQKWQ